MVHTILMPTFIESKACNLDAEIQMIHRISTMIRRPFCLLELKVRIQITELVKEFFVNLSDCRKARYVR